MKKIETPTVIVSRRGKPHSLLVQKSKMIIIDGPQRGEELVVDRESFTIGSSRHNDLVLNDPAVSQRHCEISLLPDGYVIRDLKSTNGTLVHGMKVAEAFINEGSEIQLGTTKLLFCPLQDATEYMLSDRTSFGEVLGKSIVMKKVFHIAETYAPTSTTILIQGPTGTGKEVLAEEIHRHSPRKSGPFVVVDCGTLAEGIIESELFGHVKGAYTGASANRVGAFEQADGGTILLDEIGELPLHLQPRLLRVLEKKETRQMGANRFKKVDIRVICATNVDLGNMVNAGLFREDLYYRISVVQIDLPPLKKRKDDIPILARHFIEQIEGSRDMEERSEALLKNLEMYDTYDWPGNVRELRNLVELMAHSPNMAAGPGSGLYLERMAGAVMREQRVYSADTPFKEAKRRLVDEFERKYILDLLDKNDWNVSASARMAEIERAYLIRLIKKHGLIRSPK